MLTDDPLRYCLPAISNFYESKRILKKRHEEEFSRESHIGASRRQISAVKNARTDREWTEQKTRRNGISNWATDHLDNHIDRVRIWKVMASPPTVWSSCWSDGVKKSIFGDPRWPSQDMREERRYRNFRPGSNVLIDRWVKMHLKKVGTDWWKYGNAINKWAFRDSWSSPKKSHWQTGWIERRSN
jgi:hypothetical protein